MNLDPTLQKTLLELARTQRALEAAPSSIVTDEQKEYERLVKELEGARSSANSAQLAVDDMENEILRIQEDERKLRRREQDDKKQLTAETDLERRKDLKHDRYAAKSRIGDLLYELKEAHNEIHALRNNRDVQGARVDDLTRKVEVAKRAADAANEASSAVADPASALAGLRQQLPDDILAEYDRQRIENEVGAASFNGRTCGGCFIVLPPADRSAINNAPVEAVPQCPNCGSYLVR